MNEELYKMENMEEVHLVLKIFVKYKFPGRDGWMVEFFLNFLDLIGPELVQMVEQSRIGGHITGTINHTFIALIPKHSEVGSFTEYKPISLCNLV